LSNPILFPKLGSEAQANLFEALSPNPAVFQDRLLADRANLIIPASLGLTPLQNLSLRQQEGGSFPPLLHLVVATLWPNAVTFCTLIIL
jgi:hypothetical protein